MRAIRARTRAARAVRRVGSLTRWWAPALCVVLGAVGGSAHALLAERQYAASGQVLVAPVAGADPAGAVGLAQAMGRVATGEAVLGTAAADAGVPVAGLRQRVRAVTSPDAPMIEITGTAARPEDAARAANAVARALVAYGNDAREGTGAELAVFAEARRPVVPVAPVPWLSIAVGVCAGLVVGGAALLSRPSGPRRRKPVAAGDAVADRSALPAQQTERPAAGDALASV
ncbi:lipopolysaccharide biosynthesis protein [Streptomyces sp. URMC 129]|uniref:lipopolysaccharide biosynthesis protein n=1 Tax=Streptomyces sp. URMC 129 TaxID=3423407 RepID=UPI003F1BB662